MKAPTQQPPSYNLVGKSRSLPGRLLQAISHLFSYSRLFRVLQVFGHDPVRRVAESTTTIGLNRSAIVLVHI